MKILVTGDRKWSDPEAVERHLKQFGATSVIEGEAPGADTHARIAAQKNGWELFSFPADWNLHGRAAGPIRNRRMLAEKPDLVLAFHDDLSKSVGTRDCVVCARQMGYPVYLVSHNEADDSETPATHAQPFHQVALKPGK